MVVTLLIAAGPVIELARSWSAAGLLSTSLWLEDAEAASAARLDRLPPVPVELLVEGKDPAEVVLSEFLARDHQLVEFRVVWLRAADGSGATHEDLRLTGASLRSILPHTNCRLTLFDVIVPQHREDTGLPRTAHDWLQFVVSPQDRPTPSSADAYYGAEKAVPQSLHVGAVLGGVLGGSGSPLDAFLSSDISGTRPIHAFSRLVGGGRAAHAASLGFLSDRLPSAHAHDLHPTKFLQIEPRDQARALEDSARWLLESDEGVLTFRDGGSLRLSDPPRRDAREFRSARRNVLRWALGRSLEAAPHTAEDTAFEFEDAGARLEDESNATRPASGIADWSARERAAHERTLAASEVARRQPGEFPPAATWGRVSAVATSLFDGGGGPPDWTRPFWKELPAVVPPSEVLLPDVENIEVESLVFESDDPMSLARCEAIVAELRDAFPLTSVSLQRAMQHCAARLRSTAPTLVGPNGARVVATAKRLASERNKADSAAGQADAATVARAAAAIATDRPPTLLEQLRGAVLGELLYARLTSERRLAASLQRNAPSLDALEKGLTSLRRILGAALAVGVVTAAASIVLAALGLVALVPVLVVLGAITALGLAATALLGAHRAYVQYMERGRRALEVQSLLSQAALHALDERARLSNADRLMMLWSSTLSNIMPKARVAPLAPPDVEDLRLPFSVQLAEPIFDEAHVFTALTDTVGRPGWASRALDALIGAVEHRDVDAPSRVDLEADRGLPGGLLRTLQTSARAGLADTAWWHHQAALGARALREMASDADHRIASDPRTVLPSDTVKEFISTITREELAFDPGRPFRPKSTDLGSMNAVVFTGDSTGHGKLAPTDILARIAIRVDWLQLSSERAPDAPGDRQTGSGRAEARDDHLR